MDKEPEIEQETSFEIVFRNETNPGEPYPRNILPDDALCATCERRIKEHSREQLHECGLKQQQSKVK